MFATIGHTFDLIKMSFSVLKKDRELLWFPVFSGLGIVILLALFMSIASSTGTLERLDNEEESLSGVDIGLLAIVFYLAYFITIFFNAALVSAALERLRGGDPNVRSGLAHAAKHIHSIIGWSIISASVGLILMILKSRQNNMMTRIVIDMIGGAWEFMTFFVVPILVSENVGPFGAIKRSSGLIRKTWGRQITASFGFMLVYLIAVVIAIIPAFLIGLIVPIAGIVTGVITGTIALAVVQALEGIFKAALYEYAMGERPAEFDLRTLQTAYSGARQGT